MTEDKSELNLDFLTINCGGKPCPRCGVCDKCYIHEPEDCEFHLSCGSRPPDPSDAGNPRR